MISCPGGVGAGAGADGAAAVFDVCADVTATYPNGDVLPGLWITAPVMSGGGVPAGRMRTRKYDPANDRADGADALWYGGGYYSEAMEYTDAADRQKRIDCFRAAELLYRHAAGRGNAVACLCLGYVYSYDRCEGAYWMDASAGDVHAFPREERAFACLTTAAEAGIAEACYKMGDLCKQGVGCEPDAAAAFHWYVRASELSARESPVVLGSVALRLGECFEEGIGCAPDFSRALAWYQRAVKGLDAAVEAGETWYEQALASARAGVKRCAQEL